MLAAVDDPAHAVPEEIFGLFNKLLSRVDPACHRESVRDACVLVAVALELFVASPGSARPACGPRCRFEAVWGLSQGRILPITANDRTRSERGAAQQARHPDSLAWVR